jgi:hypothetical protein
MKTEFFGMECRKMDSFQKLSIRTLVETPKVKHYHVLKNACLYESYKYHDEHYDVSVRKTIIDSMYNGNWLYYCYNTPIWKRRIDAYNVHVNHMEKTIEFLGTNEEDEFYGKYDYEPDNNMYIIKWIVQGTDWDRIHDTCIPIK